MSADRTEDRRALGLPQGLAGGWCRVRIPHGSGSLRLCLLAGPDGPVLRDVLLLPGRDVVLHVPGEAAWLVLQAPGGIAPPPPRIERLPRASAALRLALATLPLLPATLRGSPLGLPGRLRAALGRGAAGAVPDYALWRLLHETPLPGAAPATVETVIFGEGASRAASWRPAPAGARYLALLQHGEAPAPGALALAAAWLDRGEATLAIADEDRLGPDGARHDPFLKPAPGPVLLLSGLLTTGLMLVRRDALAGFAAPAEIETADGVRLALWLHLLERSGPALRATRIPRVLTHRAGTTRAEPPARLAALVLAHLQRTGQCGTVAAGRPLRVRRTARPGAPTLSLIVPTAARSGHVLRCLRRVLGGTAHPVLEVLVVVSRIDPADRRQARLLRRLAALPSVRVLDCAATSFNYAAVNNRAAAAARGAQLLLLNDDVAPAAGPDWLGQMAAHLESPKVGAVGARLLYGGGTVQHAGVLLGMGGLAGHLGKHRRRDDPGPRGLALVDREVSAVTAACLLLRREDYVAVGGMDEGFSVALNDVDLCLKLRARGLGIVQCAGAELWHYESLSLGRHYAGARAALEAREVARLRARWGATLLADPFHHPGLGREPGREWDLGLPGLEEGKGLRPWTPPKARL